MPEQNPAKDVWLQAKNFIRKYWLLCKSFSVVKWLFEFFTHHQHFEFPKLEQYTKRSLTIWDCYSFANGSLRVALAGAKEAIADQLKLLPGVVHSSLVERLGIVRVNDVQVKEGTMPHVQRSITQFAARQDLILVTNEPTKIELETVFLQLVGTPQAS